MSITLTEARQLTLEISSAWQAFGSVVRKAIESKIWEPYGYKDFSEYVEHELGEMTFTFHEHKLELAYAILDSGGTTEDIACAIKGVSDTTATWIERQRNAQIPTSDATLRPPTGIRSNARTHSKVA